MSFGGVVQDYGEYRRKARILRDSLLSSPNRFQRMSARENRSDSPAGQYKVECWGRPLLYHRGCHILKTTSDQAIVKELFSLVKPATLIELGAFTGGSAILMADTLKMLEINTQIYSVDIDLGLLDAATVRIKPNNVTFIEGDVNKISQIFPPEKLEGLQHPWVVIEDVHFNLSGTMEYFYERMKPGDYFIIEDTAPDLPLSLGAGRLAENTSTAGDEKLMELRKFVMKHEEEGELAVDSYFCDLFGYNVTFNWNGFVRRM